MSVVETLKAHIVELERELEKAKDNTRKAEQEESRVSDALVAFRDAVKAELRRSGVIIPADNLRSASSPQILRNGNTTHFIRNCVTNSGSKGTTPLEVKKALEQAKIKAHRNYAYAVLLRLKAKGEFVEREGRYYVAVVQ